MVRLQVEVLAVSILWLGTMACTSEPEVADIPPEPVPEWTEHTLEVTATAYNSVPEQTDDSPTQAAWGDELEPGMKVIAVSRDLIPLGLKHRVPVVIDGHEGEYLVLDKMAARWEKRIDIYMGLDIKAALQWGKRPVVIRWKTKNQEGEGEKLAGIQ